MLLTGIFVNLFVLFEGWVRHLIYLNCTSEIAVKSSASALWQQQKMGGLERKCSYMDHLYRLGHRHESKPNC